MAFRQANAEDLELVLEAARAELLTLKGQRILFTGATGFFGKWLTQALIYAQDRLELGSCLVLVTRSRERALADCPWLSGRRDVEFIESDIRQLQEGAYGSFDTIIHGAAAASRDLNENKPLEMFDTIIEGTRQILRQAYGGERFLFISSGAVYGRQPPELLHMPEDFGGAPDPLDPKSAYGEAKRAAEFLCATEARRLGIDMKIARCYAFIGPYLPLDVHFAAGNFMRDILEGKPIRIGGDGTVLRSYLYAADLIVWLIKVLVTGQSLRAYNVGSDEELSIKDLAETIHSVGLDLKPDRKELNEPVIVEKKPVPGFRPEVYVPNVDRARKELNLRILTPLDVAVRKTIAWHAGF